MLKKRPDAASPLAAAAVAVLALSGARVPDAAGSSLMAVDFRLNSYINWLER